MYNKVVVPLDGSKLAEVALPHLEEIAKGCNIREILLVSVTEKVKGRLPQNQAFDIPPKKPYAADRAPLGTVQVGVVFSTYLEGIQEIPVTLGRMARTAVNYLCRIAEQLEEKGFKTKINVLVGNPAEEIVRFVEEQDADLIVMASRGKSGFNRWDMGNIAEKVIRVTGAPVLVVKPGPGFKETKKKRRGVSS